MKSSTSRAGVTVAFFLLLLSCQKGSDSPIPNQQSSSQPTPAQTQANQLTSVLVIPGATVVNQPTMPSTSSPSVAPAITQADGSVAYSGGSQVVLPIDVATQNNKNIAGMYVQVAGATSYFNVPIASSTSTGTVVLPITIPATVQGNKFCVDIKAYDSAGNVSSQQEICISVTAIEACNKTKVSGGEGVTSTMHQMGSQAGMVNIKYDTYQVPDRIDVFQNNVWIGGTGTKIDRTLLRKASDCSFATEARGYVGKNDELNVLYDPTKGQTLEVIVSGCENGGTKWEYTIGCPVEVPSFVYDGKPVQMTQSLYYYLKPETSYEKASAWFVVATSDLKITFDHNANTRIITGSGSAVGLEFIDNPKAISTFNLAIGESINVTAENVEFFYNASGIDTPNEKADAMYSSGGAKSGVVTVKRISSTEYAVDVNVTFKDSKTLRGTYTGTLKTI